MTFFNNLGITALVLVFCCCDAIKQTDGHCFVIVHFISSFLRCSMQIILLQRVSLSYFSLAIPNNLSFRRPCHVMTTTA